MVTVSSASSVSKICYQNLLVPPFCPLRGMSSRGVDKGLSLETALISMLPTSPISTPSNSKSWAVPQSCLSDLMKKKLLVCSHPLAFPFPASRLALWLSFSSHLWVSLSLPQTCEYSLLSKWDFLYPISDKYQLLAAFCMIVQNLIWLLRSIHLNGPIWMAGKRYVNKTFLIRIRWAIELSLNLSSIISRLQLVSINMSSSLEIGKRKQTR